MDSRKLVLKQTGVIAAGEFAMSGLMLLIFAALDKLSFDTDEFPEE